MPIYSMFSFLGRFPDERRESWVTRGKKYFIYFKINKTFIILDCFNINNALFYLILFTYFGISRLITWNYFSFTLSLFYKFLCQFPMLYLKQNGEVQYYFGAFKVLI